MRKENVTKVLNELGVHINVNGYSYLIEAVILKNKKPHISTMEIYEEIAKKHRSTVWAVERSIRWSVSQLQDKAQKYFKLNYKLTNTIMIQAIEEKARRMRVWKKY